MVDFARSNRKLKTITVVAKSTEDLIRDWFKHFEFITKEFPPTLEGSRAYGKYMTDMSIEDKINLWYMYGAVHEHSCNTLEVIRKDIIADGYRVEVVDSNNEISTEKENIQ